MDPHGSAINASMTHPQVSDASLVCHCPARLAWIAVDCIGHRPELAPQRSRNPVPNGVTDARCDVRHIASGQKGFNTLFIRIELARRARREDHELSRNLAFCL